MWNNWGIHKYRKASFFLPSFFSIDDSSNQMLNEIITITPMERAFTLQILDLETVFYTCQEIFVKLILIIG